MSEAIIKEFREKNSFYFLNGVVPVPVELWLKEVIERVQSDGIVLGTELGKELERGKILGIIDGLLLNEPTDCKVHNEPCESCAFNYGATTALNDIKKKI